VVFGHLDDPPAIQRKSSRIFRFLSSVGLFAGELCLYDEARRAYAYAGSTGRWRPEVYQVPDDGINQFTDCDLWIIISDRVLLPLLPIRPYLLMVYDYLRRYKQYLDDETNERFISRAQDAEGILVTTNFTGEDARQFAGFRQRRLRRCRCLRPSSNHAAAILRMEVSPPNTSSGQTNLAPQQKSSQCFQKRLRLYYEKHDGTIECRVTGVDTKDLLEAR